MKNAFFAAAALGMISSQVGANVRPQDCRPVFPIADVPPPVAPAQVITEQVPPPVLAERRFNAAWLIPIFFAGGLILIITHHGDHHHTPVSPA